MLAEAIAIHLICRGGGVHEDRNTAFARDLNDPTRSIAIQQTSSHDYSDEVTVEIAGDGGRIRVPNGVKPKWRSGGKDGWWPLTDLQVGDNEIRAKFALNFMNHPEVRIDRLTGHIAIRAKAGDFDGDCQPYDPATARRRF